MLHKKTSQNNIITQILINYCKVPVAEFDAICNAALFIGDRKHCCQLSHDTLYNISLLKAYQFSKGRIHRIAVASKCLLQSYLLQNYKRSSLKQIFFCFALTK